MDNTILCVKWGDKYDDSYVEKLKKQCEDNCSVPFNFYCMCVCRAHPSAWPDSQSASDAPAEEKKRLKPGAVDTPDGQAQAGHHAGAQAVRAQDAEAQFY